MTTSNQVSESYKAENIQSTASGDTTATDVQTAINQLSREATTAIKGLVEACTSAELTTGTDTTRYVPVNLIRAALDSLQSNIDSISSGIQVIEAGPLASHAAAKLAAATDAPEGTIVMYTLDVDTIGYWGNGSFFYTVATRYSIIKTDAATATYQWLPISAVEGAFGSTNTLDIAGAS